MVVKQLDEILPDDLPEGLDGEKLFMAFVRREEVIEGGIAMASGCDACMNGGGGGGGGPRNYIEYGTKEESPYKK